MDFIRIWCLRTSVTGHCMVNMNIIVPKIGATEMVPTKMRIFSKTAITTLIKFQQFMETISPYKIARVACAGK
jgi:hypothetical protein